MYTILFNFQVSQKAILLSNLDIAIRGVGNRTVQQMQQDTTYTLLLTSLPTSTLVYPATSVVGSSGQELITVGDSVQFSPGPSEVSVLCMQHLFWNKVFAQHF